MGSHMPYAGSGKRILHHKTLSVYCPNIETLHDHLAKHASHALAYHSDAQEYRDLLETTICAPRPDSAPFPPFSFPEGTQQEAINRILHDLGKKGEKADVLVLGTRVSGYNVNVSRPGIELHHAWSASSVLHEGPWKILRDRLGDDGFKHLILSNSIYISLGNNSFVQLSGKPVHELYSAERSVQPRKAPKRQTPQLDDGSSHRRKRRRKIGPTAKNKAAPANITLTRRNICYGRPSRTRSGELECGLSPSHILNKLKVEPQPLPLGVYTDATCVELLRNIFPTVLDPSSVTLKARGSQKRVDQMVGVMRDIITRHARIDYARILGRCLKTQADINISAYPAIDAEEMEDDDPSPLGEVAPVLRPVSHNQVCRYLGYILRKLLPPPPPGCAATHYTAIGSEHNLQVIVRNARTIVKAKMFEPVNLHFLMQDVRINDFTWLCVGEGPRVPPQEAIKRRRLAENFVFWLCEKFIIPLIRASFYATETATTRYETVYYDHDAWDRSTKPHMRGLQQELLEEVKDTVDVSRRELGVAAVRLIPKPTGFRPIVNLGRKARSKNANGFRTTSGRNTSTNEGLTNVHHVLTFEKNRNREALGSCLFGTNEVFAPIQSLKNELRKPDGTLPQLYFVKMDIKSAFDTIKQDKLLEVIDELLDKSDDYSLMKYYLLLPPASQASQRSSRRLYKTRAAPSTAVSNFRGHAVNLTERLRNAIVVDLGRRTEMTRKKCMDILRQHIQNNIWQVGDKHFRQRTGIPQGSKVSSLLCSIFYSALERDHLGWTRRPGTKLLRYIDDFLLITTEFSRATRFVQVMCRGFPEYGAHVSPAKSLLSFEMAQNGQSIPVASVASDGHCYFPFCGFLIDTRTLDFSIDIERQLTGHTRQTFALRNSRTLGSYFIGWFSRQLENRNHVAYLDTHHNSEVTVLLNVFVNFAFTTMKVPHYFGKGMLDARRAERVHEWLTLAIGYTFIAGKARVHHESRNSEMKHHTVRRRDFTFIAICAMRLVLKRKESRFGRVMGLLQRDLTSKYRDVDPRLLEIVQRGWGMVKNAKY